MLDLQLFNCNFVNFKKQQTTDNVKIHSIFMADNVKIHPIFTADNVKIQIKQLQYG